MARAHKPERPGALRRGLVGSALLLAGASLGLLIGSVFEGPRLVIRRWTEQVATLEIAAPATAPPGVLEEFEALQRASVPAAQRSAPRSSASQAPPAVDRQKPSAAVAAVADVAAHPPKDARALIDEMKRRHDATLPKRTGAPPGSAIAVPAPEPPASVKPAAPSPEPAPRAAIPSPALGIQVAAYRDEASAAALVGRLLQLGFDAYLSGTRAQSPNQYRVRVRPGRGDEIGVLKAALEKRGFVVWVTRE